jgi:primosomal protein N' (replication factor Y)
MTDPAPRPGPGRFADVILPLPLPGTFTYAVPLELDGQVVVGGIVEVPFGRNKRYTALVAARHDRTPSGFTPKPLLDAVESLPVVGERHLAFWRWMADYYLHPLGDVMTAALPGAFRLNSETRVALRRDFDGDFTALDDQAYVVAEALTLQRELGLGDVQRILQRKTVMPVLRALMAAGVAELTEELKGAWRPKTRRSLRLAPALRADEPALREAFEALERRAPAQLNVLLAVLAHEQGPDAGRPLWRPALLKRPGMSASGLKGLLDKGIVEEVDLEVSRLESGFDEGALPALSPAQEAARRGLEEAFARQGTALLHGVTGSGKTELYMHFLAAAAAEGRQGLYLVPEIALTSQLVGRLRRVFGDRIGVYHSRAPAAERVETWKAVASGALDFVIGARSAVFLPFRDLGLVVVDEEHDASFKQFDPSPRYHARDAAVWLAGAFGAKALLGSATPSLESADNAARGKYGLVRLDERYGGGTLPEVQLVDLREEARKQRLEGHLSHTLAHAVQETLDRGEQVILFQNRRGYAPTLRCHHCGWVPQCTRCDVSLTFHKGAGELRCHLCGYRRNAPADCPACGSGRLAYQGFGTEKIEDELALRFPSATVARMDLDTTRGRKAHERLVAGFEQREIDVLVGTQMVTKGLDFEGVSLVGVLSADALLWFPDFRSQERAFQLMAQVSGRAGRHGPGRVLIQAWDTTHPVLAQVMAHDYDAFYAMETAQRRRWDYPPYTRLIRLTVSDRDAGRAADAAKVLARHLSDALGERQVLGPAAPAVARVRNRYRQEILLKLPKRGETGRRARAAIRNGLDKLALHAAHKRVQVAVDTDPL